MQWRAKTVTSSRKPKVRRQPRPIRQDDEPREDVKVAKLSRTSKPPEMSLEEWQIALRRQFGREQDFQLKNLGADPVFSEFEVANPKSKSAYRIHIRGRLPGDNHCSCPDFATNNLGTCKHIEFTLSRLEEKRGSRAALASGYQPAWSEVYLHYGPQREVRFRPGSACSVELARLAERSFGSDSALLPRAHATFERFLERARQFDGELRVHEDAIAFLAEVRDADRRQRLVDEAFPRGIRSAAFKNLIKTTLYDYQREGALFAARAGRCLIGDEMGLGKTIQALATTEVMARLFGVERVLIVCPTSLKHQWQSEIERFTDRTVEVVNGLRPRRASVFRSPSFFKVMNYDTVYMDLDLIDEWSPDLVILDEAQRIKNWNTRVARCVKRIASPYAIVLTGTPLENRLEELISIVQFVDRYRLGPTWKLLSRHQLTDAHGKVIGYQKLDEINQTLSPVLIRRQKDQVLQQLPERIDNNIFVTMTPLQARYHREAMEIVARIVQKWRRYRFLSETDRQRLMIALQRMRMACDSSYLVDHKSDQGLKCEEAMTLLDEMLERPDTKVVIFSQWVRMHELLEERLRKRRVGHVLFHGGVPGSKRKDLVDRFREDPKCRVFLSTDAGGVGLNLQHASVVFNMDLPWNPAVLEQRIGRVHRLGQQQPVRVVNFVARGTIEEGMLSVLKFKKSLFAGVLDGGKTDVFLGESQFNRFMESVEATTSAVPEEALLEDAEEALREATGETQPRPLPFDGGSTQPRSPGSRRRQDTADGAAPAAAVPMATDALSTLLTSGVSLLQQLATAGSANGNGTGTGNASAAVPSLVQRDERTGETFLKVPMPSPEVLEQCLRAVGALLEGLRR